MVLGLNVRSLKIQDQEPTNGYGAEIWVKKDSCIACFGFCPVFFVLKSIRLHLA